MARDLGHPSLILTVWFVGALMALAGALSYSELGAALPLAGGEYVYLRRAYGPLLGFLSGWTSFAVGFSAAIAAGAISFAAYVLQLGFTENQGELLSGGLALALIWTVTLIHTAGSGPGGSLQRVLTVLKVGAVLLLLTGGLLLGRGSWGHLAETRATAPSFGLTVISLIFATYAYSGWNAAAYLAGEIHEPAKTIPRTMIGGTVFVGLLYLAVNVLYFYALPVAELAAPPVLPVASKAAVAMLGSAGASVVTAALCLSMAGAVSAMIWAGPRVYFAMARDGALPRFLAEASPSGVPRNSILLQSLWASVLVLTGTFEKLVIYSGTVLAVFTALAAGAVMVLRRTDPALPRPFRIPLYPLAPAFYVAVSLLIVGHAVLERPLEAGLGAATVLAGLPVYYVARRTGRPGRLEAEHPSPEA